MKPLVSDEEINARATEYAEEENCCYSNDFNGYANGGKAVRDLYEADRAKAHELLRKAQERIIGSYHEGNCELTHDFPCTCGKAELISAINEHPKDQ